MAKKFWVAGIATIFSLFISTMARAATVCTPPAICLTDPLGGSESFTSVATAVAVFLFWDIALPLCTIMVLVGAFQLITSSGDPEKVSKGRKTILYAAVGFAIALVAGSITNIIKSFITGA
ncbi:MAG TPA: hypothetical protein VMR99_02950 [Candidatus Paceibacterota bacterium]|nr:hypothetical protein [Candidatus Paceibacterota bacterium]